MARWTVARPPGATTGGIVMTRLFGTIASVAMAYAFLAAGDAAAKAPTDRDRAAYLSCYRKILQQPKFAALDPAGLYAIRDTQLAEAVIAGCRKQIQPYRDQLTEVIRRSQEKALAKGGTQLPAGRLTAFAD